MFILDKLSQKNINLLDIIENNEMRIYICGPTLYRRPHLGNFRSVIFIDFLISILKYLNINTIIYSSITDIGHCFENNIDKVLHAANTENTSYYNVVSRFYKEYVDTLHKLNIKLDKINYVAASNLETEYRNHLDIINNNNSDNIYYDKNQNIRVKQSFIDKYKEELIFKGKRLKEFVIWKSDYNGIYSYNNNIGNPGWHMECFSIINKFFNINNNNNYVDMHIGGIDLLDIHNNAEIIHSKLHNKNCKIAKIWAAIGTINLNNSKMSKSENNVLYCNDFIEKYGVSVLKLIIYNRQYDSIININIEVIQEGKNLLEKIIDIIGSIIFNLYPNPNKNIDSILLDIGHKAQNINIPLGCQTTNTRTIIKNIINCKESSDIYLMYKLDEILNTCLFKSFLYRQKLAQQLLYLQEKRMLFKSEKRFKEADLIREEILNNNLKITEEGDKYFIY